MELGESEQSLDAIPNQQMEDKQHGKIQVLSIGAMAGEGETLANGIATAYLFEDGGTVVGVQLNIKEAPKGTSYVAWAESDSRQYVKLGTLENTQGDVRHSMRFDSSKDLSNYSHIIITSEQNESAQRPGTLVASGKLKVTGK